RDDRPGAAAAGRCERGVGCGDGRDRKSTRLNSSHVSISYAVFCLKKKTRCPHSPPARPYYLIQPPPSLSHTPFPLLRTMPSSRHLLLSSTTRAPLLPRAALLCFSR